MKELFTDEKIDLDFLSDMSDEIDYWLSCYNFISQNWKKNVETLSQKQLAWAHKILEDAVEKRIEG